MTGYRLKFAVQAARSGGKTSSITEARATDPGHDNSCHPGCRDESSSGGDDGVAVVMRLDQRGVQLGNRFFVVVFVDHELHVHLTHALV